MILGDATGLGKTVQTLRLLVYMKRRGELSAERPAIVVVPPHALESTWVNDAFHKFTPSLLVAPLDGEVSPAARRSTYAARWPEVYLVNYPILLRDRRHLVELDPSIYVFDEGSTFKNHGAQTSSTVKALTVAHRGARTLILTATAIQTQLLDLHSLLEVLGLNNLPGVGTAHWFRQRYYNFNAVQRMIRGQRIWTRERDRDRPYQNLDQLQRVIWPYYFRRTYRDIPGEMPELSSRVVWLDLHPAQRRAYENLRNGVLPTTRPTEREVGARPGTRRFALQARAMYLAQAAVSLRTLDPAGEDVSSKLDWLMDRIQTDWAPSGTKIVVFSRWRQTIMNLVERLRQAGVGHVVMAGKGDLPGGQPFPYGTTPREREPHRRRFFDDPSCLVCIGTTAIEMAVNLHAAPVLINLDLLSNPARMEQLAGRIWRRSSPYGFVQVISLLCRHTVEEGLLRILQDRQGLIDHMNGDESQLFGSLSEADLEHLVTHNW